MINLKTIELKDVVQKELSEAGVSIIDGEELYGELYDWRFERMSTYWFVISCTGLSKDTVHLLLDAQSDENPSIKLGAYITVCAVKTNTGEALSFNIHEQEGLNKLVQAIKLQHDRNEKINNPPMSDQKSWAAITQLQDAVDKLNEKVNVLDRDQTESSFITHGITLALSAFKDVVGEMRDRLSKLESIIDNGHKEQN